MFEMIAVQTTTDQSYVPRRHLPPQLTSTIQVIIDDHQGCLYVDGPAACRIDTDVPDDALLSSVMMIRPMRR